jgi:DsbC/DsbD-like thiol-disulfide interchange protein
MRHPALIAAALALVAPAAAGETPWRELAPGVKARLISADTLRTDGTVLVGLEIDMPANTKTYWRLPGETGIAAELDFTGSRGVGKGSVQWPYPTVDQTKGYLDYVYYGPTVLPIAVSVEGTEPEIALTATLGICSEICVPAIASFHLPLALGTADPGHSLRLTQAMAEVPLPWDGQADAVGEVEVVASPEAGVTVALADTVVEPESVIVDADNPALLFGTPQKSPDGRTVFLPLLDSDTTGLEGVPVRVTFMTATGPYEITRVTKPASTESAD